MSSEPANDDLANALQQLGVPTFPYRRDALTSGDIVPSDAKCPCCHRARGAVCTKSLAKICPWCFADGWTYQRFGIAFFDAPHFGDAEGRPIELPKEFEEQVFGRTVPFSTFGPFTWWVHCGEPAEYITRNEPFDKVYECRGCGQRQIIPDWMG